MTSPLFPIVVRQICISCQRGSDYAPGPFVPGWFRPCGAEPKHGPLCAECAERLDKKHNAPKESEK